MDPVVGADGDSGHLPHLHAAHIGIGGPASPGGFAGIEDIGIVRGKIDPVVPDQVQGTLAVQGQVGVVRGAVGA